MIACPVRRRTVLAGAVAAPAAAAAGLLAGCSTGDGGQPAGVRQVRVLTGLGFQGREAHLYVAGELGFYDEVGLQVRVLPGEGSETNLTLLAGGQAEFATVDVSSAFIEHSSGAFTDFVLTAVLHDRILACLMVLASSDIRHERQLQDATVAVIPGGTNTVLLPAFADMVGFDADSVEQVTLPPGPQSFGAALGNGQVDAIMQFVVGRGPIEAFAGEPVRVFAYADWLSDLYGSGVGCSRRLASEDPDLVRRFNTATMRGLAWAVEHPGEAGEIMARRVDGVEPEQAAAELRVLADYVRPGVDVSGAALPLGEMSPGRLAGHVALLESIGAVRAGFDFADVAVLDLASA